MIRIAFCFGLLTVVGSAPAVPTTTRTFEFNYAVIVEEIPDDAKTAHLWIPIPPNNTNQTIEKTDISTELQFEKVNDLEHGNQAYRFLLPAGTSEVNIRYVVKRHERANRPTREFSSPKRAKKKQAVWLEPDALVPIDGRIKTLAQETTSGATTDVGKARKIYDYAVTELKYDKSGEGWGNGDVYWACDEKRGNCTDFHALFTGYTRAVNVPSRFEIGFPIPDEEQGKVGGYHCWAQFFLHGQGDGWVPVDASEAHKNPEKREYFFGNLDENRVLFTVGRDLKFPTMKTEPLNYFIYPHVEVNGQRHKSVGQNFSYKNL